MTFGKLHDDIQKLGVSHFKLVRLDCMFRQYFKYVEILRVETDQQRCPHTKTDTTAAFMLLFPQGETVYYSGVTQLHSNMHLFEAGYKPTCCLFEVS